MPEREPPPTALVAAEIPPRAKQSNYPEPFAARMRGRDKRAIGDAFGLTNFGVNLTRLAPGATSAIRHAHSRQDELVYVLEGRPTLRTDAGETRLGPGMCAGFKAGTGNAHHLVNDTSEDVVYLEVGDRTPGDEVVYPDDDLRAALQGGHWKFFHKDGTPYATTASRDVRLRPATPADRSFLHELHHRVYRDVVAAQFGNWDEAEQDAWFEQSLAAAAADIVEVDGIAVGMLAVREMPDRLELVELQIAPERQSEGIGRALLARVLERARQQSARVELRVLLESRARALYERHGFRVVAQTPTHHLMHWIPG